MTDGATPGEREASRVPRRFKLALAGIGVLLLVTVPLWAPLFMRRMDFFRVRRIEIVGTRYIATTDIVGRARLDTTRSVWDPTGPITDRVQSHPGVERAVVRRKLPGTIVITITEYQPIALVPGPQGFRVFDQRGVALPIDPTRVNVDVPVLANADTALLRLLAAIRADLPAFYRRVSEIKRVGTHELMFQLDAAPVRTLSTVSVGDLNQLESVEIDLRRRAAPVAELDLRYSGQIIARLQ
jgi:cell division septal protein FtsQ